MGRRARGTSSAKTKSSPVKSNGRERTKKRPSPRETEYLENGDTVGEHNSGDGEHNPDDACGEHNPGDARDKPNSCDGEQNPDAGGGERNPGDSKHDAGDAGGDVSRGDDSRHL